MVRDGHVLETGYATLDADAIERDGPPGEAREQAEKLGEAAFEHAPIPEIVVDDDNRVVGINQAARSMFTLRHQDVGRQLQDLEISYRPVELRSLIDVRSERHIVTQRDVRWQKGNDAPRTLDVEVSPLAVPGEQFAGVIVTFVDSTEHRALEEKLERARRELETAYEELQSAVEELETTNEELQSTNEELETMNEQLQSTNEELETMSDELRERTDETLQANSFLGSVLSGVQASTRPTSSSTATTGGASPCGSGSPSRRCKTGSTRTSRRARYSSSRPSASIEPWFNLPRAG